MDSTGTPPASQPSASSPLDRGIGLPQAAALNITNMVGIGPFITIPLFLAKMNGPQAMVAWVVAAVLVLCDGLVWSELGAALPGSGGTYHFFREIYGRYRWGRLLPFLFIWQFLFSGALELASGYNGIAGYVEYVFQGLARPANTPGLERPAIWIMAGAAVLVIALLCRRIRAIGWLAVVLLAGTLSTVVIVIAAGLAHGSPALLEVPPGAFTLNKSFFGGLGAAMLIAIYDYLGYYNICHLGDEVRDPARTIPRAILISVAAIALIYLTMNVAIIMVVPWQEAIQSQEIAAVFMEKLFGRSVSVAFTWLVLWTGFACLFSMTVGYSRILFAAARNGDFFRPFAYLHPRGHYPLVSLVFVGGLAAVFTFLPLGAVIEAAVLLRIAVQFIGQIIALHILRTRRPDVALPFRMKLYPLPSLVALVGWCFVLANPTESRFLLYVAAVLTAGCVAFAVRELLIRRRATPPAPGGRS